MASKVTKDESGRTTITWEAAPTQGGVPLTPVSTAPAHSGGTGGTVTTVSNPPSVSGTGSVTKNGVTYYYINGRNVTPEAYEASRPTQTLRSGDYVYSSKDVFFGTKGVGITASGERYDVATGIYLPGTGAYGGERALEEGKVRDYSAAQTGYSLVDNRLSFG